MKKLDKISLDLARCKSDLAEFKKLLDGKAALKEREDILPFFRTHENLAALIGAFNPKVRRFDRIAHEFGLFGDYACDLVIGDSSSRHFCFVEFEDATPTSVFVTKKGKSTPEWSSRFDHGFSQIIDWFLILDDQKRTGLHKKMFEVDLIEYIGLLVIGRMGDLDASQRERMVWRSERVSVAGRQVNCITFDELYETLEFKIKIFG